MHAHRIKIFDRTHNDDIVLQVPHHLEFVFLPPDQRLFDQHLADRAHGQGPLDQFFEFFAIVGDVAAGAAHGERRSDDGRKPHAVQHANGFVTAMRGPALRHAQPDPLHRLLEGVAILRLVNGLRDTHRSIGTPYLSSVPRFTRPIVTLSAVCPPIVGSSASGRSRSMTFSTTSSVIGST